MPVVNLERIVIQLQGNIKNLSLPLCPLTLTQYEAPIRVKELSASSIQTQDKKLLEKTSQGDKYLSKRTRY